MQGNYFLVKQIDHATIKNAHRYIDEHLQKIVSQCNKPAYIKVEEYTSPRTTSANALYWKWNQCIAEHFNKRGLKVDILKKDQHDNYVKVGERAYDKDDVHDILKRKHIGTETVKKGKTICEIPLSSAKLNKSEFCNYMNKIEVWCFELLQLTLPNPIDNEYEKWKEIQNK